MDKYESDGRANLRADPTVKTGSTVESPSGAGKDAGGTENLKADFKLHSAAPRVETPGQKSVDTPPGLQHFNDDAT